MGNAGKAAAAAAGIDPWAEVNADYTRDPVGTAIEDASVALSAIPIPGVGAAAAAVLRPIVAAARPAIVAGAKALAPIAGKITDWGRKLFKGKTPPGTYIEEGASRLVGANRAQIDPRKFTEYALNPGHPVGGNKARVFESAFGFNRSNADDLIAQLKRGVMENTPVPGTVDKFGTRFTVDIPVTGPTGAGVVRTGWIYDPGSMTPRLTTAYPR